jgi:hypothetical protein
MVGAHPNHDDARMQRSLERLGGVALGGAAAFLVPWIAHLDRTLPDRAAAEHWRLAWVGLDGAIAAGLAGTVALNRARRREVVPVGVATATLMVADSWFDVCTSGAAGRPWAVASACCELSLALVCVAYALRHGPVIPAAPDASADALPLTRRSDRPLGVAVGSSGPSDTATSGEPT